jgi:hypothetical protein
VAGAFQRLADGRRTEIEISIDGDRVRALQGDTLLTAILLHHDHLRLTEIGEEPRAGFCLMGACQDCWVSDSDGRRLRACTTYVRPGLAIVTGRRGLPAAAIVPKPPTTPDPDVPAERAASADADISTSAAASTDEATP